MSMLAALADCYDRLAEDDDSDVAPFGYSPEKVSFELLLSVEGDLVEVVDRRDRSKRKPAPMVLDLPRAVKRTVAVVPNFLWDKSSYVLGVGERPKDRTEERHLQRLAEEHAAFKTFNADALAGAEDEGLCALLEFLKRWSPDRIDCLDHQDELLKNPNLVFRLDGERRFLHQRPAARALWATMMAGTGGPEGLCLVSGERGPLARLHPSIKGVRGGQSSGASIVSFNRDAFKSYGKDQGQNAPVSELAASAYTTALNHLLRPSRFDDKGRPHYRNRVQIADASTVFWAESQDGPQASAAELLFGAMVDPLGGADDKSSGNTGIDSQETARIRNVFLKIADGRPLKDVAPELEGMQFYVLGLAPNAARISIRFWHQNTLGNLADRFQTHWHDLAIEPSPWPTAPAIWRLVRETAAQGKTEKIPPKLAGEVMRAILTGGRYPRSLLAAVVMRMRADRAVGGLRAAICKACLARDFRKGIEQEDVPVSLDRTNPNPGYRLGRLFAVLESAQKGALGREINATIRDKYYGAASATPASVFPMLLRNVNHHLAKMRKDQKGGLAYTFEREIGEILDPFPDQLPRNLRIEEQGRFAIGYYHQRFAKRDGPTDDADPSNSSEHGA